MPKNQPLTNSPDDVTDVSEEMHERIGRVLMSFLERSQDDENVRIRDLEGELPDCEAARYAGAAAEFLVRQSRLQGMVERRS